MTTVPLFSELSLLQHDSDHTYLLCNADLLDCIASIPFKTLSTSTRALKTNKPGM